jgi:hypothetical protein
VRASPALFERGARLDILIDRGRHRLGRLPSMDRLPDCNSRDRGGILGTDEHLRREESVAMKIDRIQPEGMSVRLQQGKPA